MFETIPVDKIGVTNKRLTNLEYLGQDMIEAGNEFGAGTPYGKLWLSDGTWALGLSDLGAALLSITSLVSDGDKLLIIKIPIL